MEREELAYANIVDRLLQEVPELAPLHAEHLRDNGELLPHVFFGDITRFTLDEARARRLGPSTPVVRIVEFMERALVSEDVMVRDLVGASFVENLFEPEDPAFLRIKTILGPHLAECLNYWTGGRKGKQKRGGSPFLSGEFVGFWGDWKGCEKRCALERGGALPIDRPR